MNRGIFFAIGAYVLWGLLPVYWKWLHHVPALQVLCHRIVWSFLTLLAAVVLSRQWYVFRQAGISLRVLRVYTMAALLISINWFTYIWAVEAGFIIETSLGYFINPLFSVFLGVIFFRERLRPFQWAAITVAAIGVIYLTIAYGTLPWIALTLAGTFGAYGLVKKIAPLGSLFGLTLETGVMILPALFFLGYSVASGRGVFFHARVFTDLLLLGTGFITMIPLLLFSSAARRIPLSLIGILQYIAPILQFLLGVLIYREPFNTVKCIGFGIVWVALIIYGVEGFLTFRGQSFPVMSV